MSTSQQNSQQAILDAIEAIRREAPYRPAIDIATSLGISEGELQAARIGNEVMSIAMSPDELAGHFAELGRVKALTRSAHAVLEGIGHYPALRGSAKAGLMLDPGGLDMRLHFSHWHWACLIRDDLPSGQRLSLQIFDQHGRAVHKIFALDEQPPVQWQDLLAKSSNHKPAFTHLAIPQPRPLPSAPDLADDWAAMNDVHQFFALLRRHALRRHEANALMQGRFTRALPTHAIEHVLTRAADTALPLMLFVASPGCVQIRTGRVPAPIRRRGWLNLFAEDFTLHLDDASIDQAWQVHKPNQEGGVTSLEAFDAQGELILQIYAERREGQAERSDWRELLAQLDEQSEYEAAI